MRSSAGRTPTLLALVLLGAAPTRAATLERLDLDALCARADRIVRGAVVEVVDGSVEVGGGTLPTTTYRLRVEESFKGEVATDKETPVVELRTIGKMPRTVAGRLRLAAALPEVPRLEAGRSYLLFLTEPSAVGLSSPVGLGQGCFSIVGAEDKELAINGFGNLGLAGPSRLRDAGSGGPLPYPRLAAEIRAVLSGS